MQLHKQLDDAAAKISSRPSHESAPSQRQMDLELELLERKLRLFIGRAELIEKRDQPMPREVQDDLAAIQEKWNKLVKLADAGRLNEEENDRLRRRAAEVTLPYLTVGNTTLFRSSALRKMFDIGPLHFSLCICYRNSTL